MILMSTKTRMIIDEGVPTEALLEQEDDEVDNEIEKEA